MNSTISVAFFVEKATEYSFFSHLRCFSLILLPVLPSKATKIDNLFDFRCLSSFSAFEASPHLAKSALID